jgi:hypothetical protein
MRLHFNMLLTEAGLDVHKVRLLRHQSIGANRLTPYALWRDDVGEFERYQSAQVAERRAHFALRYWAGFVVPPDGSTLFVGLYEIDGHDIAPVDWIDPLRRETVAQMQRNLDIYRYRRLPEFDHFVGRLKVAWGDGKRSWSQRADSDRGSKPIIELLPGFKEPEFPGYTRFVSNLAAISTIPVEWIAALRAVGGVYLLTCPRTKEQYVGAAYGADGFWGRWQAYVATGHGGNEGLRSRDPSDYQISILEVVGSAASTDDIIATEQLWKAKLQSREMGLNRN